MIKSVTVTNYLGESITIDMQRPDTSGFYIKSITGLGPSKANINIAERATVDGGQYSSAHVNTRNIVIKLGFLFSHGIEAVRRKSYKYFPIKKKVTLLIETDMRTCETYGYVESNEPDIFSKEEGCQISILCPDPYFYSAGVNGVNVTVFSATIPMFEFPFMNNSLTSKQIIVGDTQRDTIKNVFYDGEAEIGANIYIHAIGAVSNPTIYNEQTRESMKIDTSLLETLTGSGIIAGDDIVICTIKGQKSIKLFRNGEYTNIINCLDRDSEWFQLVNGDNVFVYTADSGVDNLQFKIESRVAYEGV